MYSTNKVFMAPRVCAIVASLLLAGCASGPKNIEVKATADQVINRDAAGRSLSVVVHIYQLKESGEFAKLTFDTLASGRPLSELIGKDLLEVNEVMLVPGSTETRTDKIHQDAKHIGIVAFFRQPDQQYWRVLADADQVRSSGINFRVQDCFLSLTVPKPTLIPGQPPAPPLSCPRIDLRAASVPAAPTAVTQPGTGTPQGKRGSTLDTARQAAEAIPTIKP